MASKNLNISSLLDLYGGMLTEKQQNFLDYYYNDDLSLSEIAQNEGITRQGVYDKIQNGENPFSCAENIKKIINYEED